MDYLYINSIIREVYKDIPCGCSFPVSVHQKMQRYLANDDFMRSSVENNISCFTLRSDDDRTAPVLVLANSARQHSSKSLGRFTQSIGWVWNSALFDDGYNQILETGFYTEQEVLDAEAAQMPVPFPTKKADFRKTDIQVAPDTMRAVLTALILRWTKSDAILRIAVPNGVNYTDYAISAAKLLYSYMPYALRMQAGFTSYLSNTSKELPQIYFAFVPEEQADNNTLFLNGSSVAVISRLLREGTHRKGLDRIVSHLCSLSDDDRKAFLKRMNLEAEQNADGKDDGRKLARITPKDYSITSDILELTSPEGTLEEKIPQWRQFFRNEKKYPLTARKDIEKAVEARLEPAAFASYFRGICTQDLSQIDNEYKSMAGFCAKFPKLTDELFRTYLEQARKTGASYSEILTLISDGSRERPFLVSEENRKLLQLASIQEKVNALIENSAQEKDDILKEKLLELYRQLQAISFTGTADAEKANALKDKISRAISGIDDAKAAQLLHEKEAEFQRIQNTPTDSAKALDEAIQNATAWIRSLQQTGIFSDLYKQAYDYIEKLKELRSSSGRKYQVLQQKYCQQNSYFDACEIFGDPDYNCLDPAQKKELSESINQKKPQTYREYAAAFEQRYHTKLSIASLATQSQCTAKRILMDLDKFPLVSFPVELKPNIADTLDGIESFASKVFPNAKIAIQLNGEEYRCDLVRQVICFESACFRGSDKKDAVSLLLQLSSLLLFSGKTMPENIKSLPRERNTLAQVLTKMVLPGRFAGASEEQYKKVYRDLYTTLSEQTDKDTALRIMDDCLREARGTYKKLNPTAEKELKAFLKKNSKKAKNTLLIVLIALIVLLMVGIVFGACYLLFRTEIQKALPAGEIVETIAPSEYQENAETAAPSEQGEPTESIDPSGQEQTAEAMEPSGQDAASEAAAHSEESETAPSSEELTPSGDN